MTTKRKDAPSGASARRRKRQATRPTPCSTITIEQARRWFEGFPDMPQPNPALLAKFVEWAQPKALAQRDAGRDSVRYAQQFLSTLEREAAAMLASVRGEGSDDDLRAVLGDVAPSLIDEAIAARKNEIDEAEQAIRNAGDAAAAFLNWHDARFGNIPKAWHDAARSLTYAARLTWTAAGRKPARATPHSPLTEFVALALADLGFRTPKGKAPSIEAVSAVLLGKRGDHPPA